MSDLLLFLVKQSAMGKAAFASTLSDAVGRCWQEDATGLREAAVGHLPAILAHVPAERALETMHVLARYVGPGAARGRGPAWSGELWLACAAPTRAAAAEACVDVHVEGEVAP